MEDKLIRILTDNGLPVEDLENKRLSDYMDDLDILEFIIDYEISFDVQVLDAKVFEKVEDNTSLADFIKFIENSHGGK